MRIAPLTFLALTIAACQAPTTNGTDGGAGGGFGFGGGLGLGAGSAGGGTAGGGTAGGGTAGGGTAGGGTAGRASLTVPSQVFDPKVVASSDGALHITYRTQTPGSIVYGRCAADCGTDSSWSLLTLHTAAFVGASRVAVGPDLRVHVVYEVSSTFTYATCAGDCTTAANWTRVDLPRSTCTSELQNSNLVLGEGGRLSFMSSDNNESNLCVTTCGSACGSASSWTTGEVISVAGVRAAWGFAGSGPTLHVAYDDKVNGLRYRSCAGDCTVPASWQGSDLFFYRGGNSAIALAAAPGGRIHLAYNQGAAPASAPAQTRADDGRLLVWQCAGACGESASWQGVSLGALGEGVNGLAVAATQDGAVLMAAQSELTVHVCEGSCGQPSSWGSAVLESAAALTAALPDPYALSGCMVNGQPVQAQSATWAPEKPAFALTTSGGLLAFAMSRGLRTCPGVSTPTIFPGYGRLHWVP